MFKLTLVQPIRHAVGHGRRPGVRDPDDPAVAVPVDLVVQVVFVHEHEPAARRRPSGLLDGNLFAVLHRLGDGRERQAIPAKENDG